MSTLLVLIVLVAALACPAHALWRLRRGQRGCSMLRGRSELSELQRRQRSLAHRLENHAFDPGGIDDRR